MKQATFGTGCFWCSEAVFQRLKGVEHIEPGYSGGTTENPSYQEVCTGTTGHAEVIRIEYDEKVISYEMLLTVFWHSHDPTTLNRQGNDVGTQYRSVIFYHNEQQKEIAEASLKKISASGLWKDSIVTEIAPLTNYYSAEDYHKNYYNENPTQAYCTYVIAPKIAKLYRDFKEYLK